jgi:hypothetical protein
MSDYECLAVKACRGRILIMKKEMPDHEMCHGGMSNDEMQ